MAWGLGDLMKYFADCFLSLSLDLCPFQSTGPIDSLLLGSENNWALSLSRQLCLDRTWAVHLICRWGCSLDLSSWANLLRLCVNQSFENNGKIFNKLFYSRLPPYQHSTEFWDINSEEVILIRNTKLTFKKLLVKLCAVTSIGYPSS